MVIQITSRILTWVMLAAIGWLLAANASECSSQWLTRSGVSSVTPESIFSFGGLDAWNSDPAYRARLRMLEH